MPKLSAGLLLYRITDGDVEVLIGHPGGPFWARKDEGAWSIPKGEYVEGEDPWTVAQREFEEELGKAPPDGPRIDFAPLKQPSGKVITAFAVRGDLDLDARVCDQVVVRQHRQRPFHAQVHDQRRGRHGARLPVAFRLGTVLFAQQLLLGPRAQSQSATHQGVL